MIPWVSIDLLQSVSMVEEYKFVEGVALEML